jgi:hypothetical protein
MKSSASASPERTVSDVDAALLSRLVAELEEKGAVRLPPLVDPQTLTRMKATFRTRLQQMRCNNCDGYERTERKRLMVQDVLTLEQGFVDLAIHPLVKALADDYLGSAYELCEAKGWRSLPTRKDFHGWHGDKWYDQTKVNGAIPRELKVAMYLSDVTSGAFQYIAGSHRQTAPHHLQRQEVEHLPRERMIEFLGPAGTVVLFDTSGIHRQGIPIRTPRDAIFYNYHDTTVPLQSEDVAYYRYHPLLLNAAFLGNLSPEDCRILGFGNKLNYQPNFVRKGANPCLRGLFSRLVVGQLAFSDFTGKVWARIRRLFGR